jgi:hypothetical protein
MATASTYLMDPTVVLDVVVGTTPTSFDITDQVSAVTITEEATVLDRTTFGNTWRQKGRGLKGGTIQLEFYVDFDNSGIFDTFTTLWEDHETVGFTVTDNDVSGKGVSGEFVMHQVPSFAGAVDEYNTASLTFDLTGPVDHFGDT